MPDRVLTQEEFENLSRLQAEASRLLASAAEQNEAPTPVHAGVALDIRLDVEVGKERTYRVFLIHDGRAPESIAGQFMFHPTDLRILEYAPVVDGPWPALMFPPKGEPIEGRNDAATSGLQGQGIVEQGNHPVLEIKCLETGDHPFLDWGRTGPVQTKITPRDSVPIPFVYLVEGK